jgi:hypothetical protein
MAMDIEKYVNFLGSLSLYNAKYQYSDFEKIFFSYEFDGGN